jgi:POT family proton-dependent oligopeptide transporter
MEDSKKVHTPSLFLFSFAEFWDRFSFYGILSILLLYLPAVFSFSNHDAYAIWGVYLALGFATLLLGGLLADKVLGFEKTVLLGIVMMLAGSVLLLFYQRVMLYGGLALLLCGVGLFKGNISSLVGALYNPQDVNREKGFTIFFMAMQLGALSGPIGFGLIIKHYGWRMGFASVVFANLLSLLLFFINRKKIVYAKEFPKPSSFGMKKSFLYGIIFGFFLLVSFLFAYPEFGNKIVGFVTCLSMLVLTAILTRSSKQEARKIIGLMFLNLLLVLYYAASAQVNGSLIIEVAKFNLSFAGWNIPPTFWASLEPAFALILAPFIARLWSYYNVTLLFKLVIGFSMVVISFAIFYLLFSTKSYPLLGLTIANLFLGISVACVVPVHISAITLYAPQRYQGTLMGMSFLTDAMSGYVGSQMIRLGEVHGIFLYANVCWNITLIMCSLCVVTLVLMPLFKWFFEHQSSAEVIAEAY